MRFLARGRGASLSAIVLNLLPWALLSGLFVAVGVMHVASRVLVVDLGYKLSKLEQEGRDLTREHDRLKLELATQRSPALLEKVAREKLKMAPPPAGAVFTVPGPSPHTADRAGPHTREQGG